MRPKTALSAAAAGGLLLLGSPGAGLARSALEHARTESIIEGERAAGIRLGDSEDDVIAVLGGPPGRTERLQDGARADLVYAFRDPSGDWDLTIRVTFTSYEMGVEAIQLIIGRRPPAAPPYRGRTTRGYRPGEPMERARALYGSPDGTVLTSPGSAALWWYREAGLVFLPGETVERDRHETRFVVLNPYLSPDDLVRLVADR